MCAGMLIEILLCLAKREGVKSTELVLGARMDRALMDRQTRRKLEERARIPGAQVFAVPAQPCELRRVTFFRAVLWCKGWMKLRACVWIP